MGFSIWHLLVVVLVIMLVFGTKRLPGTMEDLAKGVKAFKRGLKDDDHSAIETDKDKSGTKE
jgi:sec-independent protein translocase protein TatA